jgi:hypothetical protein
MTSKLMTTSCHLVRVGRNAFARVRRLATALVLVAGCNMAVVSAPPGPVNLGISNGTDLIVDLFVNDGPLATYAPHDGALKIDTSALPPMPWNVQARSASGRVLASMRVTPDQLQTTAGPGGVRFVTGSYARVDLSCGTLRIWAGDITPSGPAPNPSAGHAGDCDP